MAKSDITLICDKCGQEFTRKYIYPRQNKSGRTYCGISCRNSHLNTICKTGFNHSEATKKHLSVKRTGEKRSDKSNIKRGENHPRWKGGVTAVNESIRKSMEYKHWRRAVYSRDNYTCVLCGTAGTGKNLNADHIKPFSLYPDLRFDVDNGRTLCVDCHKQTPTY